MGLATIGAIVGGTLGFAHSGIQIASGLASHDIEDDFARGAARTFGADEDAVSAGVKLAGAAISLANIGQLPGAACRLVDSASAVARLSKTVEAGEACSKGFATGEFAASNAGAFKSGATILESEAVCKTIESLEDIGDGIGGIEANLDILTNAKQGRSQYAYS